MTEGGADLELSETLRDCPLEARASDKLMRKLRKPSLFPVTGKQDLCPSGSQAVLEDVRLQTRSKWPW